MKYGAIGAIIGHEMTHGFDRIGMMFDGDGNQVDWWLPGDRSEMEQNQACLVDQYSGYGHSDLKVNTTFLKDDSVCPTTLRKISQNNDTSD